MNMETELNANIRVVARQLARPGFGILASDESNNTIGKRLEKHGIENTLENRRKYRSLFYSADLGSNGISGAILFPEALDLCTDEGISFVEALERQNVLVGVKVDQGLAPVQNSEFFAEAPGDGPLAGETHTKGLETLECRCKEYRDKGAVFAKWRAAIPIVKVGECEYDVSEKNAYVNCKELARYAKICQASGLVPIVEPEILIDGDHSMLASFKCTEKVLRECMYHLWKEGVDLEAVLLKPQMIVPGIDCQDPHPLPQEIASMTIRVLRQIVPPSIPGIMFLSGGQTEVQATVNLNMLNVYSRCSEYNKAPWSLSFSYGRGLQASVLHTWSQGGDVETCRKLVEQIAKVNGLATRGAFLMNKHPSILDSDGTLQENFRGHY